MPFNVKLAAQYVEAIAALQMQSHSPNPEI